MDPPSPYDPRRPSASSSSSLRYPHPHHDQSRSTYHYLAHSYPHFQSSHSTHYPTTATTATTTAPPYYLSTSSRSTASESPRHYTPSSSSSSMRNHQLVYRRPDVSGFNPDPSIRKHHRAVNDLSGSRSMSGTLDQRDRKRARVSGRSGDAAMDLRERNNSRSSYDNMVRESSPRNDYRHYEKEKREIGETERRSTPQKAGGAKSRISVWNRIEESPSLAASPSSSNLSNRASTQRECASQENKPETEASAQSVGPEKDLVPAPKAAVTAADVTGKKKKKVVIRRRIVKKKGKGTIDDSTVSSSSPVDPIVEGTASDIVTGAKRRVKRVLLVKKKKTAKAPGETSMCSEEILRQSNEEIVRQLVNEVFSEKKSGEGSKLSPQKSADEIESKAVQGKNMSPVVYEKNSTISDGMTAIGTSRTGLLLCAKEEIVEATSPNKLSDMSLVIESVDEAPSNLKTATQNEENEIAFTIGSEDCTKEKEMMVSAISSPVGEEDCIKEEEIVSNVGSLVGDDSVKEKNEQADVATDDGHEMMSPRLNNGIEYENIENRMEVDVPREEEIQVNHYVAEEKADGHKDQEMKNCPPDDTLEHEAPEKVEPALGYALTVSGLDSCLQLKPQEVCSSDLDLGQYLPQTENKGNGAIVSTETSKTKNNLSGAATNGDYVSKAKLNQEVVIQKNHKEIQIQKPVHQKSVSVSPVPKFAVQKPRHTHRTWRREATDAITSALSAPNQLPKPSSVRNTLPPNSYVRMGGHRLIRSANGTTVPNKSPIPRIPSPNTNRPVLDMSRDSVAISSIMPELGEDKKGSDTAGGQNSSNNKVVYFKTNNNQIVLNNGHSSNSQNSKGFIPLDNAASTSNSNSDDNKDLVHYLSDSAMTSKNIDKAPRRMNKVASYPNVWTLSSMQSKRKDGTGTTTNRFVKSIPYVLPWKRTTLLKNSPLKRPFLHRNSTSWLIRKLLLARRRDTVYAVSKNGFSLRKTGVLAVGMRHLKWSRSIEKCSKKASEEATLAVAEAERKKREKRKRASLDNKGKKAVKALFATGDTGNGKQIGSHLNKLSACSGYVRASKGNQLVRDPKRLVRILASEKIQRSLHTLRNAKRKKQQYCVFYTRFGRCNKTNCHYLHDPAKIAICTKFLRGICDDTNCKLTHQIIPERMPDCSYFLQGLCSNLTCSYRHVNVNPKAPVCEGFLKGYCADGDECRKKHSYTCPEFEEKGKCLLGAKCKLYHPKIKSKSKIRKVSLLQKAGSRPRYFESSIDTTKPVNSEINCEDLVSGGQFGDFVRLHDARDECGSDLTGYAFGTMEVVQSDPDNSDCEMDDELIKPLGILTSAGLTVS